MIRRFQLSNILVTLCLLTAITSAWPWPPSLEDFGVEGLLVRRQDNTKSDTTSISRTATAKTNTATSKTASPASTAKSAKATGKASETAKASQTGKASKSAAGTATTTKKAAVTSVNPALGAGGVNMLTPAVAAAQTTYYRIGDHVTFAWNYTSLEIEPSKIDVIVSCSANSATYTLSSNASFESSATVVWDTAPDETGTAPLLTETYTLIVYDAAEAATAVPEAGKLGASRDTTFGMYIPQKYLPREQWRCAVCSAAISDTERQALKLMFGMCLVTVLSFTWFVSGIF